MKIRAGPDGSAAIIPDGASDTGIFVRRAIDHFTVNALGLITRMITYDAPPSYWH